MKHLFNRCVVPEIGLKRCTVLPSDRHRFGFIGSVVHHDSRPSAGKVQGNFLPDPFGGTGN
jgi:hypothetical protein